MSEALVKLVLGKLCDAVFDEVARLCGVGEKAELVKRHLERIQCFLIDADRKRGGDVRVRNWVNELRGVSFWIEDAIDTFLVEVDRLRSEDPDVMEKIKKKNKGIKDYCMGIIKKPKKLVAIHQFGVELDKILARIEEITNSRETYGIKDLGESSATAISVPVRRPILPDLDDTELVGFEVDLKKIVERLVDETILRRSVITIVGIGGLGKTTIAQKAYSSDVVKSRFEVRMWLSISQEFKLVDLLKKMLLNVPAISNQEENGEEYLMTELNKSLRKKKYLIVMDDVWSNDLWTKMDAALPDVRNGSRVLITSRISEIAKRADPLSKPYELPFLSEDESLELLRKKALPSLDANENYPAYLLDIAKQLTKICDGLPLALVVLGGLLSIKSPTRHVWEDVLKTMDWVVDGKNCMDILSTTYNDIGFITPKPRKTLEEIANNHLEELAQRHMVIVVGRHYDDSIKTIRVHDLLRDLAVNRAKEDNLITVFSDKAVTGSLSTVPRRVALQSSIGHWLEEHTGPNLRSLHSFVPLSNEAPNCSRYKMLKVCNMDGTGPKDFVYNKFGLERSTQLRFLRVYDPEPNWTNDSFTAWFGQRPPPHCSIALEPSIGQLKNLQTLDLRWVFLRGILPESVWGITTLRHVLLHRIEEISGPPSWAKLENLQTLKYVKDSKSWQTQVPHLTNVRCLKLCEPSSFETSAPLFQTLENLISLHVGFNSRETFDVADMRAFPFYRCLRKLNLSGKWPKGLDLQTVMLPPHLIKLRLHYSQLEKDPMPELGKLQCLKTLILHYGYSGKKMICSVPEFPCLEQLELNNLGLEQLEIEEGAMPTLKLLKIKKCWRLRSMSAHLTCPIEWERNACSLEQARRV